MNNFELEIKTIKNDLNYLRQISKKVNFNKDDWKIAIEKLKLFGRMNDNVVAISSIQLGIPLRIIYIKNTKIDTFEDLIYNNDKILINPVIINREGLARYWETCVSCLNYTGLVERPYKIEIEYYDQTQVKYNEIFVGYESTILSHEIDHLNGILHIDKSLEILKLNKEQRKEFREKHPYEIIRKNGKFTEK